MRRAIMGFALGLFLACDLSEALEHEPCAIDKDCWHTQRCARTPSEVEYNLPGLCLAEDEPCAFGEQLGCGCDPADSALGCTPSLTVGEGYPQMQCDPEQLVCVIATEEEGETEESETEG